jgi:hypothetical protein
MDWHPRDEKPESGRRIVALFNDGSGARLLWVHDHGMMDNDGDESEAIGKDYCQWAYLPDGFRIWIEDNLD